MRKWITFSVLLCSVLVGIVCPCGADEQVIMRVSTAGFLTFLISLRGGLFYLGSLGPFMWTLMSV